MDPNQIAERIRSGRAADVVPYIEANPQILRRSDASKVPVVHLLALTRQLSALTVIKNKLTTGILETLWGPGWSVPHTAAQTSDLEAISDLLLKPEYEHLLAWPDANGDTPIHIAARHGNMQQLVGLLESPQLAQRNERHQTPVHIAAIHGFLYQLKGVLTPELLVLLDTTGSSALAMAESHGCLQQIDNHVARKARILLGQERRTLRDVIEEAGFDPNHVLGNSR